MQVLINGVRCEYTSDFDPINIQSNVNRKWMVSAGDYFKFPVPVGGSVCFVKRFGKPGSEISGYNFLLRIKGERKPGLPLIHDLVRVAENGKEVSYLFMEYLKGDTLDHLQRKGFSFVPLKLAGDLHHALGSIHMEGFWFPDFDPKNIFRDEAGNFYLIDLDSTYPLTDLPNIHIYASHDYWSPPWNFYKSELKFTIVEIKQIRGDTFNMLHLLYLLLLYAYYINEGGEDLSTLTLERLNAHYSAKYKLFTSTMQSSFYREQESGKLRQRPLPFPILSSFIVTCLFPEDKPVSLVPKTKPAGQRTPPPKAVPKAATISSVPLSGLGIPTQPVQPTRPAQPARPAQPVRPASVVVPPAKQSNNYGILIGLVLLVIVLFMASRGCFSSSDHSSSTMAQADSTSTSGSTASADSSAVKADTTAKLLIDKPAAAEPDKVTADSTAVSPTNGGGDGQQTDATTSFNLTERFQSRASDWFYPDDTTVDVNFKDGYLELKMASGAASAEVKRFCNLDVDSDFMVSARIGFSGYGTDYSFGLLYACAPTKGVYYYFYITPAGEYTIAYFHEGHWTNYASGSSDFISRGNVYNTLMVRQTGGACVYYVNGGRVATTYFRFDGGTEFGVRAEGANATINLLYFEAHGAMR